MPEGYKCDCCGSFSRYMHNATVVEFQRVTYETGEQGSSEKILCPDCGQQVWNNITGRSPPEA